MLKSVTLLGSSSGRNAGDAALMSGIMESIDAACGTQLLYEIPTIAPSFVKKHYSNRVRPISIMPWNLAIKIFGLPVYRSVMRTDLSIIFDAVLFDRSLYNPLFNFLSTFAIMLPRAKKHGKRLGCYNVGLGPVSTPVGRKMLKDLLEIMDFITVRDEGSMKILREIGVGNPRVQLTADAALNVQHSGKERGDAILRGMGLEPGSEILAVNVNRYMDSWAGLGRTPMPKETFIRVYGEALNRIARATGASVLFVVTQHHDVEISRAVMERLVEAPRKALITNLENSHYDIQAVLSRVSMLFAMRLHAMILASSSCTPIVGLTYQPKVRFYFERLGLERFAIDFDEFAAPRLAERVVEAWGARGEVRAQLERRIPALKREALQAADLVSALHRGEDLSARFAGLA